MRKKLENYTSDVEGWKRGEKEFVEHTRVNKKRAAANLQSDGIRSMYKLLLCTTLVIDEWKFKLNCWPISLWFALHSHQSCIAVFLASPKVCYCSVNVQELPLLWRHCCQFWKLSQPKSAISPRKNSARLTPSGNCNLLSVSDTSGNTDKNFSHRKHHWDTPEIANFVKVSAHNLLSTIQ